MNTLFPVSLKLVTCIITDNVSITKIPPNMANNNSKRPTTASRGSRYFAPLYSENGEIKTWLYIGNLAGLSLLPYDSNENELGREIPIPVSRDTDPKTFIDYIKTNGTNI